MTDTRKTAVLWTLLVVTVATFVFSPFLVGQRSWGFDYFRYLTPPIRWALSAGLILTVLAPLLRQLAAGFSTAANVTNRQLYGARGEVWRLGFCAVACALFYTFWVDTFFLGDGYQTIANYASASGVYFHNVKITSLGSSYLARGAQSLFGLYSETTARLTFRILSTLSGGIVVWNLLGIARIMSADPVRRLLFSITAIITPDRKSTRLNSSH